MPLIKLTDYHTDKPILLGTEQIIEVKTETIKPYTQEPPYEVTTIRSVGAMVTNNTVKETVEEVYSLYN